MGQQFIFGWRCRFGSGLFCCHGWRRNGLTVSDNRFAGYHSAAGVAYKLDPFKDAKAVQHDSQNRGDHDIHRGSRNGDHQFLPRNPWHSFQSRHAADRKQCDIDGGNSKSSRSHRVAIFVQGDTKENAANDCDQKRNRRWALIPTLKGRKCQQQ